MTSSTDPAAASDATPVPIALSLADVEAMQDEALSLDALRAEMLARDHGDRFEVADGEPTDDFLAAIYSDPALKGGTVSFFASSFAALCAAKVIAASGHRTIRLFDLYFSEAGRPPYAVVSSLPYGQPWRQRTP